MKKEYFKTNKHALFGQLYQRLLDFKSYYKPVVIKRV